MEKSANVHTPALLENFEGQEGPIKKEPCKCPQCQEFPLSGMYVEGMRSQVDAYNQHKEQWNIPQSPAKTVNFNGNEISVFVMDGEAYITASDLGRCLGFANPRKGVLQIFERNRKELSRCQGVLKLKTPSGIQDVTVFNEKGCNLIAMFARTDKAKEVRDLLATLPQILREIEIEIREKALQAQESLKESLADAFEKGRKTGVSLFLRLLACPAVAKLGLAGVSELVWARQRGDTQAEVGERLGISTRTLRDMEKALKELGISFPAVSGKKRKREIRQALAYALGEIPPVLPGPERDA